MTGGKNRIKVVLERDFKGEVMAPDEFIYNVGGCHYIL